MNALAKLPVRMTVDEFLAWEPGDGRKWELVDGVPRAMAPAKATHSLLQSELARLIGNHLLDQKSPCRTATEAAVVPRVQSSHNMRVPDVIVTCTPGDGDEGTFLAPVVIAEILSPGNQSDTWNNIWAYTSILTVQEVLVMHSTRIGAELLRRGPDGAWPVDPAPVASGDLVLDSIGLRVPLADVYRTTRLRPGA